MVNYLMYFVAIAFVWAAAAAMFWLEQHPGLKAPVFTLLGIGLVVALLLDEESRAWLRLLLIVVAAAGGVLGTIFLLTQFVVWSAAL